MYRAPRGTTDILPDEQVYWSFIRQKAYEISVLYGYRRVDTPAFEDAGLFVRSIGEDTDIVEKETYTFDDRSGDKLTLRPEGTASICRAYIEHGMHTLPQPVRLYYDAAIFRYERPQAGRYRQHHQYGVEALGEGDPALDAEVIDMAWQFYANLGLKGLSPILNSIGCSVCRPTYLNSLMEYYTKHRNAVCSDCRRRLERNPLRLLDCKKPSCVPLTEQAPRSTDHLCPDCSDHFSRLSSYLRLLNLPFVTNHRLVRGLDYYTKTVFEIAPEGEESAQATVGAGGRYDDLIEQLGGRPTPAIGFATGIERLILNMKKQKIIVPQSAEPFVFVAHISQQAKDEAMKLASLLRRSGISVIPSLGDRSLKAQLKQANSMGANKAVIIGEDEAKSGTVVLRDMAKGEQNIVPRDVVVETLRKT
ncbi:MAG: histidine--tRNA ligase [Dehalococcoidia bacterium]|nr:MAG: histidine--tRNA ligase [Dehalococcoidia bacterium]